MTGASAVAAVAAAWVVLSAGSALAADDDRGRIAQLKTIFIEASSQKEPAPGSSANLYPPGARQFGVEGNVLLRCATAPDDKFSDCEVVEEIPKGKGFAASAQIAAGLVRQAIPNVRKNERVVALLPFNFVLTERKGQELDAAKIEWEKKPSADELTRAYPELAERDGREGWAILGCDVTADGRLSDCRAYDEWPHGFGFSDAAMKVSQLFKMRLPAPSGGRIRFPIFFKLPKQ